MGAEIVTSSRSFVEVQVRQIRKSREKKLRFVVLNIFSYLALYGSNCIYQIFEKMPIPLRCLLFQNDSIFSDNALLLQNENSSTKKEEECQCLSFLLRIELLLRLHILSSPFAPKCLS